MKAKRGQARAAAGRMARFAASGMVSAGADLALFALFDRLLRRAGTAWPVPAAVLLARCVSAAVNYLCNRFWVFVTSVPARRSAPRYCLLCCCQALASAALTGALCALLPWNRVLLKALVDGTLFFASYAVQRRLVFR